MLSFYLSACALLAAFFAAGVMLGRGGAKKDYSLGGRKAGAAGVTGILLGSLVGGASTVGTVQMAYSYGMTAWWFALGGGIGCLLLALRFAVPLRRSRITTIADYLNASYGGGRCGRGIALAATAASSLGTFISICAQFLSCIALLRGVLPLSVPAAALVAALSIWGFVAFGGMKSFAKLGEAKIALLFVTLTACAAAALGWGGSAAMRQNLTFQPWLNPFGRGFVPELGYLASMIVGVFTTQIYIQSFAAAKNLHAARRGAFASALIMPPMGLLGTAVGLSVRASGAEVQPDQVFSWFIMNSFPPLIGGLLWVIGTATTGSMILEWSFLSMGLRGAGSFIPFVAAVLRPGLLPPVWALASCCGGLAAMLAWAFARMPGDPLFAGLAVSAVFAAFGALFPTLFPGPALNAAEWTPAFRLHLLLAIAAYSFMTIALVHAVLMALQNRHLKHPTTAETSFLDSMPGLVVMERIFFRIVFIGFLFLTAVLVTGAFATKETYGVFIHLDHKMILTWIAWALFGVLLLGRRIAGWRAKTALRWFWAGFAALAVAYLGYSFILEVF